MKELLRFLPKLARAIRDLIGDPGLPRAAKIALAAALAYLLSPIDLVPDFVPIAGVLDDVLLAAVIIDGLLNYVDRRVVLRYWPGEPASLERVARVARWLAIWVPRRIKQRIFASG
jgi:uncharacterized membrane protein YkvA (DUF1232 family)